MDDELDCRIGCVWEARKSCEPVRENLTATFWRGASDCDGEITRCPDEGVDAGGHSVSGDSSRCTGKAEEEGNHKVTGSLSAKWYNSKV